MEKGLFQSILPKKEDILKELSEIKELLNSDKEAALERIKYVEQQCKISRKELDFAIIYMGFIIISRI